LLELANVNYEAIDVGKMKGGLKGPEFAQVNPKGIVPSLFINGKFYAESAASLRMLVTLLPGLENWYPADNFKKHTVDAALDFVGTEFRPKLMKRNMAFWAQMANNKIASPAI